MDNQAPRTHFYHADANAVGGRIERPFDQIVPVQAALSLPASGGFASARSNNFNFQSLMSFRSAESKVAGSQSPRNGAWTTVVSTALEGLNILNVVTADRVVAQISTEHPAEGYTPKVSFVGTQFMNLRISGKEIDPMLNFGFCDPGDGGDYPGQPLIENGPFLAKVDEQHRLMHAKKDKEDLCWTRYRDLLLQRYPLPKTDSNPEGAGNKKRGMVLCSLVQELRGDCPGKTFGHVLVIPDFGKISFGELLVDHNSFHLIMLRLELGCPVAGTVTAGDTRTNGSSYP
jgi:hypothetical protein